MVVIELCGIILFAGESIFFTHKFLKSLRKRYKLYYANKEKFKDLEKEFESQLRTLEEWINLDQFKKNEERYELIKNLTDMRNEHQDLIRIFSRKTRCGRIKQFCRAFKRNRYLILKSDFLKRHVNYYKEREKKEDNRNVDSMLYNSKYSLSEIGFGLGMPGLKPIEYVPMCSIHPLKTKVFNFGTYFEPLFYKLLIKALLGNDTEVLSTTKREMYGGSFLFEINRNTSFENIRTFLANIVEKTGGIFEATCIRKETVNCVSIHRVLSWFRQKNVAFFFSCPDGFEFAEKFEFYLQDLVSGNSKSRIYFIWNCVLCDQTVTRSIFNPRTNSRIISPCSSQSNLHRNNAIICPRCKTLVEVSEYKRSEAMKRHLRKFLDASNKIKM